MEREPNTTLPTIKQEEEDGDLTSPGKDHAPHFRGQACRAREQLPVLPGAETWRVGRRKTIHREGRGPSQVLSTEAHVLQEEEISELTEPNGTK